jgi:hypothetical protein
MKYEGNFVEDFKEGFGTLYLANGEKFIGEFKQDMVSGQGKFVLKNGEAIEGFWDKNQLIKQTN